MSTKKITQQEFIERCTILYGNRYTYEDSIYLNSRSNVSVYCREHGEFTKNARSLLSGAGCPKCNDKWNEYVKRSRLSTSEFIIKATDLHEGFYGYNKVNYVNSRTPVIITCPIHGDFTQTAGGHLEGYGCKKCANKKHGDYRPWFIKTYFDRYPENKDIPAILYLLYCEDENFFKVGITTKKDVNERIKYMKHYTFKVVDTVSDTMYNVCLAEQEILSEAEQYIPIKRFGGYSECIKNYVDIREYIPKVAGSRREA